MPTAMGAISKTGEKETGWVSRLFTREGYTPEYQELKFTLHRKLLDRINLEALSSMAGERVRAEIRAAVAKLVEEEKTPLRILAGQFPLVAEYAHIAEAAVLLQVYDSRNESAQDLRHIFIAGLGKSHVMPGVFDDHFVRAQGTHPVVDALGATLRVTFDPVERTNVGGNPHVPLALAIKV